MPDMDGPTVIRRVRFDAALRTTPCVLLTGTEGAATEVHALDVGADAFVRKEADLGVILARVGAVLRSTRDSMPALGSGPHRASAPRILAIDDSSTYLHGLADQLRDEGYDVALATSGEEAIDLLAVQDVDCILLDRQMPGLSGAETCKRIKAVPGVRDIPLMMLTADDGRDALIDSLAAGADDFISKSSGLEILKARVKAQIRRKQFEDEHRHAREQLVRGELAEELALSNASLAAANQELEAFSYSVSHDLRAPLRAIGAFTQELVEHLDDTARHDDTTRDCTRRVLAASSRMTDLIDALLEIARIGRAPLAVNRVDLSAIATTLVDDLRSRDPERRVDVVIAPDLTAKADARLVRALLDNLLGNAWKFTAKSAHPRIELGRTDAAFFVRDNGAGFDMSYAQRLFAPFQRLHPESAFPGTGIGLATVKRVVDRHGGQIWVEAEVDHGATFRFTLPG
jgi:signal transduction histidine kinase